MSTRLRYALLVNPHAGAGRATKRLPQLRAELDRRGMTHRIVETTGVEHGCREARAAAGGGEIPVVVSGDGLVGKIGGTLAGTGSPLGILPGGRGNDLARVLGIPTEPAEAVAVLARDERRLIDVGEANGQRFLCIASCGFDSDANRIANDAKLVRGPLVYAYAALRALAAWSPARFAITLDGRRREITGYSVAVANSAAYGGGMFVAPGAVLDDGLFDVVCTASVSKLRALANMPKLFRGTHLEQPEVSCERAAEVGIDADRPFAVYADGEHLTDLPATVRVLPRALELIAPAGS